MGLPENPTNHLENQEAGRRKRRTCRPRGAPRARRCLLKGCEQHFHPRQARQRYCSGQAPLSAAATAEDIAAAARSWNQCLTDVASSLGVQLPAYVLFTRLDSLTGFPEFVSNLGARETDQAIGATIRPFNAAGRGTYAEETARAVNSHFSQVVLWIRHSP